MPGLIIIGSYVQKTSQQMKKLHELSNLIWIEWEVSQAKTQECLKAEVDRVIFEVKKGGIFGPPMVEKQLTHYCLHHTNWFR